jgi:hypothetical protein
MSWFVIVLIVLVLAMMIGPIMMVKPSRRDRRVAQLRARATKMGLRVSLQRLEQDTFAVYELPWEREDNVKLVGVDWMLERRTYAHEIHFADWWQWRGPGRPPAEVLPLLQPRMAALPEGVPAIEATRLGLRCYWSETGGEPRLAELTDWLKSVAEAMKPYIRRQVEPAD